MILQLNLNKYNKIQFLNEEKAKAHIDFNKMEYYLNNRSFKIRRYDLKNSKIKIKLK